MDKSIQIQVLNYHSPRFKPWAIKNRIINQNHFNGLTTKNEI